MSRLAIALIAAGLGAWVAVWLAWRWLVEPEPVEPRDEPFEWPADFALTESTPAIPPGWWERAQATQSRTVVL